MYVCLNVRVVDPVVTQLVTQQPRPECRGDCVGSVVRACAYGCGHTDTAASEVVAVHHRHADSSMPRPSVLVVTLAVGQVTKAGTTRRGQV